MKPYYSQTPDQALEAQKLLAEEEIPVHVVKLVQIIPVPQDLPAVLKDYSSLIFAEECIYEGGIGQYLEAALYEAGWRGTYRRLAVVDRRQPPGTVAQLQEYNGLDAKSMMKTVKEVSS